MKEEHENIPVEEDKLPEGPGNEHEREKGYKIYIYDNKGAKILAISTWQQSR